MISQGEISQLHCAKAEQQWIDQHLAAGFAHPALALIDYRQPAVIYGRRGGDCSTSRARAAALDYDVQQRRSGGGAVLAGPWMLGVNLLLPDEHPLAQLSHVEVFRWFGRCWRQALAEFDIHLDLAAPDDFKRHQALQDEHGLDWVCFAGISHGELLDDAGRKVLGLAQYRGSWGALLSAGLLIGQTPWEQLEFIHGGQRPERSAMHQLTAAIAHPQPQTIRGPLQESLIGHLQDALNPRSGAA